MKKQIPTPQQNPGASRDRLFEIEMEVARRADRMRKEHGNEPGRDLECWLQAEREVFGDMGSQGAEARFA